MPNFRYTAIDPTGRKIDAIAVATDARQLTANLRRQGLAPTLIELSQSGHVGPEVGKFKHRNYWLKRSQENARPSHVIIFTRQLATLLKAGMPLVRGLGVLARQETAPGWPPVIENMAVALKGGTTLSEAVGRYPKLFDPLYRNMLMAGEAGGSLAESLERLAVYLERSQRLRAKLRTAMIYPMLVLIVAAVILLGLLLWVVPRFEQIFADLLKGAPLPWLTQVIVNFSRAIQMHWLFLSGIFVISLVIFKFRPVSGSRKSTISDLICQMPVLKNLVLKGAVARLTRTLSTLMTSGVPILVAVQIGRDTCANRRMAVSLAQVHDEIKAGSPIATAFGNSVLFPPLVASLLEVGEHTGQLPVMLGRIAEIYEDEVEQATTALTSLIEPLLILLLALIVGTIVIALFLPIVRIVQLLT